MAVNYRTLKMAKRNTKKQFRRKAWVYTGRNVNKLQPFGFYALIRLEITAVKKELLRSWKKAEHEFERQQRQWEAYCNEDRPAYDKWKHMTFGSRMTEIRDLHEQLHRKSWFIDQLELVCDLYGRKPSALYRELHKKAVDGKSLYDALNDYIAELRKSDDDDNFDDDDFDDDDDDVFDNDDLKNIFGKFFHEDEDKDEDDFADYKKIFDDVFENDENVWGNRNKITSENPEAKNIQTRIRDIYRKLCFKLHPDTGCDFNAENSRLWHQIQKAYQENDLDSMLAIQASLDMKQDPMASHISCAQILSVINDFKDGLRSVRGLIRNAKQESSWAFLSWTDKQRRTAIRQIEQQMTRELLSLKYELEHLERIENQWSMSVKPKAKPKIKTKSKPEKPPGHTSPPVEEQFTRQMHFDF